MLSNFYCKDDVSDDALTIEYPGKRENVMMIVLKTRADVGLPTLEWW